MPGYYIGLFRFTQSGDYIGLFRFAQSGDYIGLFKDDPQSYLGSPVVSVNPNSGH